MVNHGMAPFPQLHRQLGRFGDLHQGLGTLLPSLGQTAQGGQLAARPTDRSLQVEVEHLLGLFDTDANEMGLSLM